MTDKQPGVGQLISSGLHVLAKFAAKLDEPRDKPVAFTQQEREQLFQTFQAMNAAIDETQQRVQNLEGQVASLKALVADSPVRAIGESLPPPPPAPRKQPLEAPPWTRSNTPKSNV
jgi:hypothetical protein